MKRSRGIRPEWDRDEGGRIKPLFRFLFRHGEKFVAVAVVIAALYLILQTRNYQPLPWQPEELEELATTTEKTINNNGFNIENKTIRIFDYAVYAEQIKEWIPLKPYRSDTGWFPILQPAPLPSSGFEILTAESLKGESARRTGWNTQTKSATQWQRPPLPGTAAETPSPGTAAIWVNLYGTIPVWEQWEIHRQVFHSTDPAYRPEYVYYELEKAEIKPKEEPVWQPVIVYTADEFREDQLTNLSLDRLIPFGQQETLQDRNLLLFSDVDVEPAKIYAYRIRLYVRNPNYNLQDTSVEEGVDTKSEFVRSDWSSLAKIYVPDRTLVQLQSVTLPDQADFPRQLAPWRQVRGTLFLDYFDIELGQSLPLVEKRDVVRGMLGNMSKEEANRYINRGGTEEVVLAYPDAGLRSDVCVMDFSGGRRLQKRPTREAQASPGLVLPGRALLLMPDGTMQTTSAEAELFK